jgi:transcriptional regulator with XRE-family HTH domain
MNITGEQAVKLRTKLGVNQAEFWSILGVTQSGGSRYESGRNIPVPVQRLYWLIYVIGVADNLPTKDMKALASIGR